MRKSDYSLPQQQQGSTLVEVLVSVFLLTFGVLGLMAAQLRSVASISEAENRNAVALAAENLADGMQLNPSVQRIATNNGVNVIRRYPNYLNQTTPVKIDASNPNAHPLPAPLSGAGDSASNISKAAVAQNQLAVFRHGLSQLPNTLDVQYVICLDNTNGEPTYDAATGTMRPNCNIAGGATDKTIIKVLWAVRSDNDPTKAPVIFTYKLHVAQ